MGASDERKKFLQGMVTDHNISVVMAGIVLTSVFPGAKDAVVICIDWRVEVMFD